MWWGLWILLQVWLGAIGKPQSRLLMWCDLFPKGRPLLSSSSCLPWRNVHVAEGGQPGLLTSQGTREIWLSFNVQLATYWKILKYAHKVWIRAARTPPLKRFCCLLTLWPAVNGRKLWPQVPGLDGGENTGDYCKDPKTIHERNACRLLSTEPGSIQ